MLYTSIDSRPTLGRCEHPFAAAPAPAPAPLLILLLFQLMMHIKKFKKENRKWAMDSRSMVLLSRSISAVRAGRVEGQTCI